jgi:hypothetical protein
MAQQPLWSLAAFQFLNPYKIGRNPWTGDQPVARPLPTHRTQTQNKCTQTPKPRVGFEPTIPVFERAKTVHALVGAATVIGTPLIYRPKILGDGYKLWSSTLDHFIINFFIVRFEVFNAGTMKNAVFWDVAPCGSCVNRRLQPQIHAGSSLADFSTLKMEAIRSSETSVHTGSIRCHIPEDGILQYLTSFFIGKLILSSATLLFLSCSAQLIINTSAKYS